MSQSYDLASWWKILQQAWNSNEGCCPMCNANKHNLHKFRDWGDVEKCPLPTGVHPRSIIPISMDQGESHYAILSTHTH